MSTSSSPSLSSTMTTDEVCYNWLYFFTNVINVTIFWMTKLQSDSNKLTMLLCVLVDDIWVLGWWQSDKVTSWDTQYYTWMSRECYPNVTRTLPNCHPLAHRYNQWNDEICCWSRITHLWRLQSSMRSLAYFWTPSKICYIFQDCGFLYPRLSA